MGNEIALWITDIFGDKVGHIIAVIFVSMLPVIELRGAIPVAFALGLNWWTAMICAIIGNILPVPFILLFLESILKLMRKNKITKKLVDKLRKVAVSKNERVMKYELFGLAIFVGIPLPGTGGWTGALIASVMRLNKKNAFLSIFIGIIVAGIIITVLTYGLIGFFIK